MKIFKNCGRIVITMGMGRENRPWVKKETKQQSWKRRQEGGETKLFYSNFLCNEFKIYSTILFIIPIF